MNAVKSSGKLFEKILFLLVATVAWTTSHAQEEERFTNVPPVVSFGSVWRFWNQDAPPEGSWKTPGYNDTGWRVGLGQLGYGDGDEATVTRTNSAPHPITAYFRTSFILPQSIASAAVQIRLIRDDGAVVYINGSEVSRNAMPAGVIDHNTVSTETQNEWENSLSVISASAQQLRAGTNVVSVEIHQANAMSTDMSFDLELKVISQMNEEDFAKVGIIATRPETSEPLPNALVVPGEFTVFREDPHLDIPLYVRLSYSGTATTNDYEAVSRSVFFPAGSNAVSFPIIARTDNLVEGTESVIATVVGRSNTLDRTSPERPYRVWLSNSFDQVLIRDANSNALPIVSILASTPTTKEQTPTALPARFSFTRTGPTDQALTVHFVYQGSLIIGSDCDFLPFAVTFAPGRSETNIAVFAIDDDEVEQTENLTAFLTTGPNFPEIYAINPEAMTATVSIQDNE
ncbi:MAG TPA: Calx-beta domain-containing protein, partial [Candidatus Kapabacteria bacterium]|nr:Calx-beta domain-containing protein [Candidatus Kapabacteria bacterium]